MKRTALVTALLALLLGFAFAQNHKIMIFGGPNHDTYLGCLSCSEYASDSVFNDYGTYGSSYSSTSIYNSYSQYGSAYSNYSPCNEYATDPPVLVDEDGNFYGTLTLNTYRPDAVTSSDVIAWLKGVCSG